MDFVGLTQLNKIVNIHGSILDLIFCNRDNFNVEMIQDCILPLYSYHPSLIISFLTSSYKDFGNCHLQNFTVDYDFKRGNIAGIVTLLNSTNWNLLLSYENVDTDVDAFYKHLYNIFDIHIPLKHVNSSNFPPWFTNELKKLVYAKKQPIYVT